MNAPTTPPEPGAPAPSLAPSPAPTEPPFTFAANPSPNVAEASRPFKGRRRRLWPLVITIVALVCGGGYLLFATQLNGSLFKTRTSQASPLEPAPTATAASSPLAKVAPSLDSRLTGVEHALRELTQTVTRMLDGQSAMQADIAAIKERLDRQEQTVAASPARHVVTHTARRVPKPAPVAPVAAPANPDPSVLSVDTWDGKPSVALRGHDGRVRFAGEGDRIATGLIGTAQPGNQTVTVQHSDGSTTTLSAKEAR